MNGAPRYIRTFKTHPLVSESLFARCHTPHFVPCVLTLTSGKGSARTNSHKNDPSLSTKSSLSHIPTREKKGLLIQLAHYAMTIFYYVYTFTVRIRVMAQICGKRKTQGKVFPLFLTRAIRDCA